MVSAVLCCARIVLFSVLGVVVVSSPCYVFYDVRSLISLHLAISKASFVEVSNEISGDKRFLGMHIFYIYMNIFYSLIGMFTMPLL